MASLIDTKVLVQCGYSYVRDILFEDSLSDGVKITIGNSKHSNKVIFLDSNTLTGRQ